MPTILPVIKPSDLENQLIYQRIKAGTKAALISFEHFYDVGNQRMKKDISKWLGSLEKAFGDGLRIVMDSGAYTVYTTHKNKLQINVDHYIDFLKKYQFLFENYISLDVIGNPNDSLDNFKKIRNQGLHPIPVFHASDRPIQLDWKIYREYLKAVSSYPDRKNHVIGLGNLVGRKPVEVVDFIQEVRRKTHIEYDHVEFHILGQTTYKVLSSSHCFYADAINWGSGLEQYGNGTIVIWNEHKKRIEYLTPWDKQHWTDEQEKIVRDQCKKLNIRFDSLLL